MSCDVVAPALIPRKPGERVKTNGTAEYNLALGERSSRRAMGIPTAFRVFGRILGIGLLAARFSRTIERVSPWSSNAHPQRKTATLIADLIGADAVHREAAIARLAIAGERAVDRLLAALADAAGNADAATVILRTLELIGSTRAATPRRRLGG